ncbi:uncharacterized protein NPIL_224041, partial [Nephila pilipes]
PFYWVLSHCGFWDNETAEFYQKYELVLPTLTFCYICPYILLHLPLHSATLRIKRIFKQSFPHAASLDDDDKSWDVLRGSHCAPYSPRAAASAMFRFLIRHDFLSAYLFRLNIISSPICVLCDSGHAMTSVPLNECSSLNNFNCIVKKNVGELID